MAHYPFHTETFFPRNVWYIAAQSEELGDTFLGRTFFDERVLLYRMEDGTVTALSGLCPHRFLPLEKGTRIGDKVRCGYHGIMFDANGICLDIPSQDDIPAACRLKKYPTIERGGYVWIWMGEREKARSDLMPDLEAAGLGAAGWDGSPSQRYYFKGRPQLVIDNLFDLTHVPFAHATGSQYVPGGDENSEPMAMDPGFMGSMKIAMRDGRLVAWREVTDCTMTAEMGMMFPEMQADQIRYHIGTEMLSPALVNASYVEVWASDGNESMRMNIPHGITPETATSTHMFVSTTRNHMLGNKQFSTALATMNKGIVEQDVAIYEATEPYLASKTVRDEITVTADAGAYQARRIIEKLMQEEQAAVKLA